MPDKRPVLTDKLSSLFRIHECDEQLGLKCDSPKLLETWTVEDFARSIQSGKTRVQSAIYRVHDIKAGKGIWVVRTTGQFKMSMALRVATGPAEIKDERLRGGMQPSFKWGFADTPLDRDTPIIPIDSVIVLWPGRDYIMSRAPFRAHRWTWSSGCTMVDNSCNRAYYALRMLWCICTFTWSTVNASPDEIQDVLDEWGFEATSETILRDGQH